MTKARSIALWPAGDGEMAGRVRAHDWATTPLGPVEAWPAELKSAVAFVLDNAFPAALAWGPDLITVYNDGFRPILGSKPEALGRSFAEIWSEAWHEIGPIAERALAGQSTFIEDYPLVINRTGEPEQAYFTFSYSPIRAADGTIVGMIDTVVETTGHILARERLRESEERFRAFVTASSDVVYRMSPDWSEMRQLDGRGFLSDTVEPSKAWMNRYIHAEDQALVRKAIERATRTKSLFELEHRVYRADGILGWTISRAVPILDEQGEIVEWLGAASDVTTAREAERALRESEERFRSFAENSADTLWIVDAETQRLEYLSPAFERMWGESRDAVMADLSRWSELLHPQDRERALQGMPSLLAGETYSQEYRIVRSNDGAVRWIHDTGFPIRDEHGRVRRAAGIAQDTTERRIAEERQKLLLAELQHRVRNTLAVVRSIARRTGETTESVEDYAMHLDGRLSAFARTQAIVTRNPTAGVSLEHIVAEELVSHHAHEGEQVRIDGPPLRLCAKPAETLALAVHELATNAVKYGALSSDRGRIAVGWSVHGCDGERRLTFDWMESGVTLDGAVPRRKGFGMELLQRTLEYELGATTSVAFRPTGLHCRIELPLTARIEMREAALPGRT